jgi:hypothetical protein
MQSSNGKGHGAKSKELRAEIKMQKAKSKPNLSKMI